MPATEPTRDADDAPVVRAHETTPGRAVFAEEGNDDGWISTDLFVEPTR